MNERIRELVKQAQVNDLAIDTNGDLYDVKRLDPDKFAELLLEDVRIVIAEVYRELPLEQAAPLLYLDEQIVEHFYGTPRKFE